MGGGGFLLLFLAVDGGDYFVGVLFGWGGKHVFLVVW